MREEAAQLSPYLTEHVERFGDYVVDLRTVPDPLDGKMPDLIDQPSDVKTLVLQKMA